MPNAELLKLLACPRCKGLLEELESLACIECGSTYPVVNSIPILLADERSVFKTSDLVAGRETTYGPPQKGWKRAVGAIIPSFNLNLGSDKNFEFFFKNLRGGDEKPKVLIIGGAVEGQGLHLDDLKEDLLIVETDVAFGARTELISDAHDLPFRSGVFDGVIAQAVLEHVIDPFRCVSEIERVLKGDGLVYAETPFMQQVHMGRYDFTRFTHLGHRYLFRNFEETSSGPIGGPGMALAWSWAYFLRSFFRNRTMQKAAFAAGMMTGSWLKYFDHILCDRPGSYDAASCYFFLGRKQAEPVEGREIISNYRGTF
ncbi:methyltransferase domain-containing protein [Leptolyngbya sp. 7M]|nr:methyltransferase domain-containing protein [Leptolyngbya sp. 7M]